MIYWSLLEGEFYSQEDGILLIYRSIQELPTSVGKRVPGKKRTPHGPADPKIKPFISSFYLQKINLILMGL